MHLTDYLLLALAAAAGLAASIGGILLTAQQPPIRAAKAAFYIAAVCFGLLGVLWGMQASDYPMSVRLGAAGITAAIAAVALTYVLSLISDHYTDNKRITTVRSAFSATESIKLWPPFLGGTDTLNLDNVATLKATIALNDKITLVLNVVPIRFRDFKSPQLEIQGMQIETHSPDQEFLFDGSANRRHEIKVEGRTFMVMLQDIIPRNISGVANPIEYIFGISEK